MALGIFIASITCSALEYVNYQTIEDQTTSPSAAPAAVYRETLVAEALSAYAAKAERLNTLLGEDVSLVPEDSSEEEAQSVGDGDTELGADLEGATTTATTSSSSSTQTPAENEGPTETDTPPEDPAPNESPAPPIEEGSIQPATNI